MFHFLKERVKKCSYAPCKGKVVPLSEVPDPTFPKNPGDGFAVIPSEGKNLCTDRR